MTWSAAFSLMSVAHDLMLRWKVDMWSVCLELKVLRLVFVVPERRPKESWSIPKMDSLLLLLAGRVVQLARRDDMDLVFLSIGCFIQKQTN